MEPPHPLGRDSSPERRVRIHLPIADQASSLRADGSRVTIVPADVAGRFTTARRWFFGALIAVGAALPLIRIEGRPAIFLDVPARRFFVFGEALNAQDGPLLFFVLSGLGFGLLVLTTTLGRAWCGWACPQTVLLEGLFRPIDRFFEGPRNARIRRDAGPHTWERSLRKIAKHATFATVALLMAHLILAYFVSFPSLGTMITDGPAQHPTAFVWSSSMGLLLYLDMAWFREQLCLIICPYGRLQSVLTDDDSLVVGYDERRGEPRGKGKTRDSLGDCVDCGRCVAVCPTGIDIRNGLQIDCIACSQCIDACDEVMDKLDRPRGLVRYDSLRGLRGDRRRFWRPRLGLYAALGAIGSMVLLGTVVAHRPFAATLSRVPGAPFVIDRDVCRNTFQLHVVNKRDEQITVHLAIRAPEGGAIDSSEQMSIEALGSATTLIVVRMPLERISTRSSLHVSASTSGGTIELEAPILAPIR